MFQTIFKNSGKVLLASGCLWRIRMLKMMCNARLVACHRMSWDRGNRKLTHVALAIDLTTTFSICAIPSPALAHPIESPADISCDKYNVPLSQLALQTPRRSNREIAVDNNSRHIRGFMANLTKKQNWSSRTFHWTRRSFPWASLKLFDWRGSDSSSCGKFCKTSGQ